MRLPAKWAPKLASKGLIPDGTIVQKPRKYRNTPTVVDGIRFDSKKEARRWAELRTLEASGRISALRRQVRFPLRVNGLVVARYVADAVYIEDGRRVVEDVKSWITRKDRTYRLKRKLMAALYGVEIRET